MRWSSALTLSASLLAIGSEARADGPVAFVNVNVVSTTNGHVDTGQTVTVRNGRIESIGGLIVVPPDALVVDGTGRWMLPGLIDAHVHVRGIDLEAYLAHGVTTVRDLAGLDSVLSIARDVESGERRGPRIITASLLLNGPSPRAPQFARVITRAADAPAVVDEQLARGAHFIKLYESLPIDVFDALVAAARARGAPLAGHVSAFVPVAHAMLTLDSIEHLSGYDRAVTRLTNAGDIGAWESVDRSRYASLAELAFESGVWNCPTLHVYGALSGFSPQILENRRAFVRQLHDHGARILAGTDSGYLVPAGMALIEELKELVASGLSPYEAIGSATILAADFLGLQDDVGVVAEGMRADLMLVNGNPLDDVEVLRYPFMVMARGEIVHAPLRRRALR